MNDTIDLKLYKSIQIEWDGVICAPGTISKLATNQHSYIGTSPPPLPTSRFCLLSVNNDI